MKLLLPLVILLLSLFPRNAISESADIATSAPRKSVSLINSFESSGTIKAWNVRTSTVEGRNGSMALRAEYSLDAEKDYGAIVVPVLENLESFEKSSFEIVFWVKPEQDIPNFSVTLLHKNEGLFTYSGQKKWRYPLIQMGDEWQEVRLPIEEFEWNPYTNRPAETQTDIHAKNIAEIRFEVSDKTKTEDDRPRVTFEDLSFQFSK